MHSNDISCLALPTHNQASLERASQYASQQSVLVGPIAVAAVSAGEEPAWTAGPKALAALLSLTRCLQQ